MVDLNILYIRPNVFNLYSILKQIIFLDGIPYLVNLLKAEDAEVRHFSSLALANLSSSTSNAR